jgi:hypothetical protein
MVVAVLFCLCKVCVSFPPPCCSSAGKGAAMRARGSQVVATTSHAVFLVWDPTWCSPLVVLQVGVSVTNVNEPPSIAPGQTVSVSENADVGTVFGAVNAWDEDGDVVSFTLGSASTVFLLSPSGSLSTLEALNFEAVAQYTIVVVAADPGGLSSTANFTIRVVDENDLPVLVVLPLGTYNVSEGAAPGFVLAASVVAIDDDEAALVARGFSSRLLYSMVLDAPACASALTMDPATGAIRVSGAAGLLDFETLPVCAGNVSVSDGSLVTVPISIVVTDVNEGPLFVCAGVAPLSTSTSSPCVILSVSEATIPGTAVNPSAPLTAIDPDAGNTVTYSLLTTGTPFLFATASSAILTVNGSLDFETVRSYVVQVSARDALFANSTVFVVINVVDVDEPPVFPASLTAPVRVAKSATAGYEIVRLNAYDPEGTPLTYRITAASSTGTGPTLTLGNARAMFAIDATQQGLLTVADASLYTAHPIGDVLALTVEATDGSALSSSATVTLDVTAGSLPPVVPAGQSRSVAENSAVNTAVGGPISATDPSSQPLTFSLSATSSFPDAMSWLTITPATGQLRVARAGLDYEDAAVPTTFTVLVTVSNGALTGSGLVTVSVLDVPEAASCSFPSGATFFVPENNVGMELARVACGGVSVSTTLQFSVWQVCRFLCVVASYTKPL